MRKDLPSIQKALQYREYGDPAQVLTLMEIPVPELSTGEVLVEMQASPIHPSDMGLIQGSYGRLRTLPSVAGREGVGDRRPGWRGCGCQGAGPSGSTWKAC